MGSPTIFAGSRTKLLSSAGLLNKDNSIVDNDGIVNYIKNGHAEVSTIGWATYANAAQATPVNGTGGSPSVTWTRTTTAPLDQTASFVFTKDAANRQGEGASYDFTIDSASQAKVLNITFDYIIGSGTFVAGSSSADSDIVVYIYDVTNSVLIQPTTFKLYSNSSTIATSFQANFQTPYNSTSYRLIFHCATTSASAYTVKFDNVKVSPSQYVYGTPITDWKSYTLTIGAVTTPPTQGAGATKSALYRRVGDSMEIVFTYAQTAAGSAGSGAYKFPIPSGLTIDTSKVTVSTNAVGAGGTVIGNGQLQNTSTAATNTVTIVEVIPYDTQNVALYPHNGGQIAGPMSSSYFGLGNATIYVTYFACVPITGWSSCVQMSDQTTQQVVAASFSGTTASSTALTQVTLTKIVDTTGTTSGNTWVVPVQGNYSISASATISTGSATLNDRALHIYIDGSTNVSNSETNSYFSNMTTATIVSLNAGQVISFYGQSATVSGSVTIFRATIQRLAGPSSIAATDTVAASYWLSANFAASTTVPINFDSREYDYQGNVQTSATAWRFTSPIAALYNVSGVFNVTTATSYAIDIYKNGVFYKNTTYGPSGNVCTCSAFLKLLAGDYIDIRPSTSITMSGGTLTTRTINQITITKVGNY